jgi:hypothetical protein
MLLGMLFPGDVPGLSEDFLLEGRPKEPVCVSDFCSYFNYFAKFLAKIDIASQSFHNQNIPRPSQTPTEEFRNSQTRTVHRDPQIHVFAVLLPFGSSHIHPMTGENSPRYRRLAKKYHPDRNVDDPEAPSTWIIMHDLGSWMVGGYLMAAILRFSMAFHKWG